MSFLLSSAFVFGWPSLLGFFGWHRQWLLSAVMLLPLGIWFGWLVQMRMSGSPSDPGYNEQGAQFAPYFAGFLFIAGVAGFLLGLALKAWRSRATRKSIVSGDVA